MNSTLVYITKNVQQNILRDNTNNLYRTNLKYLFARSLIKGPLAFEFIVSLDGLLIEITSVNSTESLNFRIVTPCCIFRIASFFNLMFSAVLACLSGLLDTWYLTGIWGLGKWLEVTLDTAIFDPLETRLGISLFCGSDWLLLSTSTFFGVTRTVGWTSFEAGLQNPNLKGILFISLVYKYIDHWRKTSYFTC